MSKKVKLTIVIENAIPTMSFLLIGFLSRYGYSPVNKETKGSPGELSFVFKKGKK